MTETNSPDPKDLVAAKHRQAGSYFNDNELTRVLDSIIQIGQEREEQQRREYQNRPFPGLDTISRNLDSMVATGRLTEEEAMDWMRYYVGTGDSD